MTIGEAGASRGMFAGDKVTASGKVYERGGSKAIVIEKIEAQASQK